MYCQKCRTPLKLDHSLEDLNPAAFKLLVDSTTTSETAPRPPRSRSTLPKHHQDRLSEYDSAAKNARQPIFKRDMPPPRNQAPGNPNMSFIMLDDSQMLESPQRRKPERNPSISAQKEVYTLSNKIETADRVFEILSARSDIDHPICIECTDLLVEGLQKRLNSTNKERDAYVEFLRQANAEIPSEEEVREAEKKLDEAHKREKAASAELAALEAEKAVIEREILSLDADLKTQDTREEAFWRERNAHNLTLADFQNERDRINTQFDHDNRLLQKLKKANVFNDTFAIGHDGSFGTINGLRLGRLPDRPVDWSEINAAWGQTCLLLDTVADKLDQFKFHGFELQPMGSTSKILEHLPRKTPTRSGDSSSASASDRVRVHELYSSGEYAISIGLFNRKFDNAMVAFLECLRQLIKHAQGKVERGTDGSVISCPKIPYVIDKDRIGDASIKLGGFNQEETWTKACKWTLICCKYLLAHASNVHEMAQRR
ncbi:APG6-domain-containing protein [Microthyrium microscopicum]|uniref:APG6-domain-containing protein n=1 Tax=Microthyrium microscopicum TaxID=703497 RepID=A0A6A6US31_9PEZI|nr:APG6-domain-containing protein [Microthyrium microscopicum]